MRLRFNKNRKKSGKNQLDLANLLGKVQLSASELSQIAEYLNIPINYFFSNALDDEEIQKIIYTIQEQPKEARLFSYILIKLFLEIQSKIY